jgi:micrococcal nuclease
MAKEYFEGESWIKKYAFWIVAVGFFIMLVIFGLIDNETSKTITGNIINSEPIDKTLFTQNDLTPTNENKQTRKEVEIAGEDLVVVSRIIDGDTIELESGKQVRLICIDTPERGQNFYEEASNYLSWLVLNKEIRLEKDVSETDKYQRLLRYVYVDDSFVNELMVLNGYAKAYPYSPDTKLCPLIQEAETRAKEDKLGIWKKITAPSTETGACQCEVDLDCLDFSTRILAQDCYDYCFTIKGSDFHRLDGQDNDRLACETLPE